MKARLFKILHPLPQTPLPLPKKTAKNSFHLTKAALLFDTVQAYIYLVLLRHSFDFLPNTIKATLSPEEKQDKSEKTIGMQFHSFNSHEISLISTSFLSNNNFYFSLYFLLRIFLQNNKTIGKEIETA